MHASICLAVSLAASAASAACSTSGTIKCPVVLSGQVSASMQLTDFDTAATNKVFNSGNVKASGMAWSQILKFPNVTTNSRFDNASMKSVEVTIADGSIFKTQYGFRRAGLQMLGDNNTGGPGAVGVRTIHWSVQQDPARKLNLTHEYQNMWHETADYSANQFDFKMGTLLDRSSDKNAMKITNRKGEVVWSTPIEATAWQNFAVTLDFEKNTLQVYYSKGLAPLKQVTTALPNDNSGEGQYQIGMLKKPTGTDDVVNSGYQESGIDEGQIYGGIFIEDSAGGCLSL
ncbi:hypothetical protein PG993_000557 [Apiospora rasikravindrae]|uniref:Glycoside hydrolase 131 catalytic N-terminal domain-containing protein n=1 Tax=Apiospora rasikravindrae TaxID=990691 RepID=A0ABR1U8X0_9PEZI